MFPVLDIVVEKGEQTYWLHDELREHADKALAALTPQRLSGEDWHRWLHYISARRPHDLPAEIAAERLDLMRVLLADDFQQMMDMFEDFRDHAEVRPGAFAYADYWERIYTVRAVRDGIYWPLVRLAAYLPLPWARIHPLHPVAHHGDRPRSIYRAAAERLS